MRKFGSQTRETLEEAGYTLVALSSDASEAILFGIDTNIKELWAAKDDHSGYTIEINGCGYEFVREVECKTPLQCFDSNHRVGCPERLS